MLFLNEFALEGIQREANRFTNVPSWTYPSTEERCLRACLKRTFRKSMAVLDHINVFYMSSTDVSRLFTGLLSVTKL
jgi:hypothetical protein